MSKWWWKADYIECCNCAHGCSCNLTMIPTDGTCQGINAWKFGKAHSILRDSMDWASHSSSGGLTRFIAATAKQDASVLAAFALHDMQLTMIQIHILEPHARQLRVSQPRINQELDHDHVSRVARVPNGFVKTDQFMIGEQFREPLLHLGRRDGQYRTRVLENLLQVLIIRPLKP